jgi:hypothetical protein
MHRTRRWNRKVAVGLLAALAASLTVLGTSALASSDRCDDDSDAGVSANPPTAGRMFVGVDTDTSEGVSSCLKSSGGFGDQDQVNTMATGDPDPSTAGATLSLEQTNCVEPEAGEDEPACESTALVGATGAEAPSEVQQDVDGPSGDTTGGGAGVGGECAFANGSATCFDLTSTNVTLWQSDQVRAEQRGCLQEGTGGVCQVQGVGVDMFENAEPLAQASVGGTGTAADDTHTLDPAHVCQGLGGGTC